MQMGSDSTDIAVVLVINCYEGDDKATVWVRLGGFGPDLDLETDSHAKRIIGPIDRRLCYPLVEALVSLFADMGLDVTSDQIADD